MAVVFHATCPCRARTANPLQDPNTQKQENVAEREFGKAILRHLSIDRSQTLQIGWLAKQSQTRCFRCVVSRRKRPNSHSEAERDTESGAEGTAPARTKGSGKTVDVRKLMFCRLAPFFFCIGVQTKWFCMRDCGEASLFWIACVMKTCMATCQTQTN